MELNPSIVQELMRMTLIFVHVTFCAIAVGFAFFADFRVLMARGPLRPRDHEVVHQVAKFVGVALLALWLSGAGILLLDFGHLPTIGEVLAKPKIAAKLFVVTVLTLNGALLHAYALPRLHRITLASAVIGGVSAASWIFAIFLGVGKPLARSLAQFLELYGGVLVAGITVAAAVHGLMHGTARAQMPLVERTRLSRSF